MGPERSCHTIFSRMNLVAILQVRQRVAPLRHLQIAHSMYGSLTDESHGALTLRPVPSTCIETVPRAVFFGQGSGEYWLTGGTCPSPNCGELRLRDKDVHRHPLSRGLR